MLRIRSTSAATAKGSLLVGRWVHCLSRLGEEPPLRHWIVCGTVVLGLLGAAPVVAPAAPPALRTIVVTKSCSAGYKHAVIGGSHKCLRRGQFCASSYKRQYVRYGFRCTAGRLR
jgi:hypothetical protein